MAQVQVEVVIEKVPCEHEEEEEVVAKEEEEAQQVTGENVVEKSVEEKEEENGLIIAEELQQEHENNMKKKSKKIKDLQTELQRQLQQGGEANYKYKYAKYEKYVRMMEIDNKTNDKKLQQQQQGASREAGRQTGTLGQPGRKGDTSTMVSRRRILSRSRDDLNMPDVPAEEEDVWFSKEKLLKDHIQEVLDKWGQIDDEIWAKVIVFEKNRRVAKAYARAPMLTVDGTEEGFDGFRIGLNGFDNPMRERKTEEILRHVGPGIKIKMDDTGSILVKRVSRNPVYARPLAEENAFSDDVNKLTNGALEADKPMTLFDMKKFGSNVSRELRRAYPDRRKLEYECVTAISFVKQEANLLECPCWIMIINLVAIDMLKARIPPVSGPSAGRENVNSIEAPNGQQKRHHHHHHHGNGHVHVANGVPLPAPIPINNNNNNNSSSAKNAYGSPGDIKNRPKIPLPRDLEDDPYAMVVNGSGGKGSRDKPPKLPPRDLNIPKPDYDESIEEEKPRMKPFFNSSRPSAKDKPKDKDRKYDDPYYCGLRARIPAFVQRALPSRNKGAENKERNSSVAVMGNQKQNVQNGPPPPNGGQRHSGPAAPGHPSMWHAKSVDSGMASIHSNPYADPLSIRKMNNNDKYSWNHTFESGEESDWENYWQS